MTAFWTIIRRLAAFCTAACVALILRPREFVQYCLPPRLRPDWVFSEFSNEARMEKDMEGGKEDHLTDIERQTGSKTMIDSVETDGTLARCNWQEQSILFSLLPREIRDLVWAFATAPYNDENHRYADNEYYCRPGHTARLRSDTNILLTCRRIWLEANSFPMLQAEHSFWYYRAAPDGKDIYWMQKLTPLNLHNLGCVHLFAQMYTIERLNSMPYSFSNYFLRRITNPITDFQPRMLHVTIRHTDWWYWEQDEPLRLKDSWVQALLDTPDLRSTQTLKLELETLDYKVNQLLPIVERLERLQSKEFDTHMINGQTVATKFVLQKEKEVYKWSGPKNIDNIDFEPYEGKDKLDYHVITLTWKLTIPQLPRVHIPTVRRSARLRDAGCDTPNTANDEDLEIPSRLPASSTESYFHPRSHLWKKKKAGRIKKRQRERVQMLTAALLVRMGSVRLAEIQQKIDRRRFISMMEDSKRNDWTARWERERALLRFR